MKDVFKHIEWLTNKIDNIEACSNYHMGKAKRLEEQIREMQDAELERALTERSES